MVLRGLGLRNRLVAAGAPAGAAAGAAVGEAPAIPAYLFTSAPRYDPQAWLSGRDRFPSGATLTFVSGQKRRPLVSAFYASADAAVFFDGTKALFAGKRESGGHWQIWETAVEGGAPRQITFGDSECIRPLYVPDGRVVYTRVSAQGSAIEIVPLAGGKAERLTFVPGWVLTDDVLRDGRILFERAGTANTRELFTVYPDGTGVESLRCDHGPDRAGARQISSGDVIFSAGGGPPAERRAGRPDCGDLRGTLDRGAPRRGIQAHDRPIRPGGLGLGHRTNQGDRSVPRSQCRRTCHGGRARSSPRVSLRPGDHTDCRKPALPQRQAVENFHRRRCERRTGLRARRGRRAGSPRADGGGARWLFLRSGPRRSASSHGAAGCLRPLRSRRARLVLDAPQRTADLRGLPCRSRARAGKQTPRGPVAEHRPRENAGGRRTATMTFNDPFRILAICLAPCFLFAADPAAGPIRFDDVTAQSGIRFTHSFGAERLGSLLESTGAGCVWLDYNNDGKPDLYVVSGRPLEKGTHPYPLKKAPETPPHNHLYRNDGNGKFTDVTDQAGVAGSGFSFSAVAADFDNDGRTDLLVMSYGRVTLYRNKGDGTFEDVTAKAGLDKVKGWAINAAWLDYDRDGCVDLFIGRYVKFDPTYRSYYAADNFPGPLDYEGDTNLLFHNTCKGSFTDVSEASGIAGLTGRAMGVTAADFDGDGYPDIYVANDKTENFLLHNKRNGTFEEIALEAGAAFGQNGESTSAMGPMFFDMDNDGTMDLWVTDSKYNRLLKNSRILPFKDLTQQAGISQQTAQYTSWGK